MSLTDAERAYLSTQRLGRLATVAPDGSLQNNPVSFHYNADDGTIDIGGFRMGETRKYRNVASNGQVAFVVDDLASVNPWTPRGVEVRGVAEALTGQKPYMRGLSGDVIRIHPRRVLSWGVDPDVEGMQARNVGS